LIVRVIDPPDHARHRELLFRQERDHEIVFVITSRGHAYVAGRQDGGIERVQLASIALYPIDVG
jgi:hypothetical protein